MYIVCMQLFRVVKNKRHGFSPISFPLVLKFISAGLQCCPWCIPIQRSMVQILHFGKLLHNYGKSPFIVDLPMKNGGSFHKCLHNCGKSPCF